MLWIILTLFAWLKFSPEVQAQGVHRLDSDKVQLIFTGNRYTYLTPHVLRSYQNAMDFLGGLWEYDPGKVYVFLNDLQDYGNGGAITMPLNQVLIGIGPYSFAFSIIPSSERFQWLFNHELTHVVMTDKPNQRDKFWRKVLLGKVPRDEQKPLSAIWSYATVPRWYAPRWYQEGIACFMETWMSGGLGRAMGYYDEMYFRSLVQEDKPIHSVVGLETEGTSVDFQVGANSYLYGTRFVNYLAGQYGIGSLQAFYNRSPDSRAFYASQFRRVYQKSVKQAWNDWIAFEKEFQKENISRILEHPLTPFTPITHKPLGNVSAYRFNPKTGKLYAAINYPGVISQICEISLEDGKIRKLADLDSPALYYSTHLAYDPEGERLFVSEQNNRFRSLVMIELPSAKKKTLMPFSRTGELVYNRRDESLWGVRFDNGYSMLVKIPPPYQDFHTMFIAPFGKSLFDLDISEDGSLLSASMSGIRGEQQLVVFGISQLESGNTEHRVVYELEDNTLSQFKFSPDGRHLIGTSYYTGVSNIWRVGVYDGSFELLSNTETGFFMPLAYKNDSLLVLRYFREGMLPGKIPLEVLHEANAIEFLGNRVVHRHPVLEEWSLPAPPPVEMEALPTEHYSPLKEMMLVNAWPDLAGFKKTLVTGYRLNWSDPMHLASLSLFAAASPWSGYAPKQQLHASMDFKLWDWEFSASWNKTDFYDLFGPLRQSRAGYSLGLSYERMNLLKDPRRKSWKFGLFTYGMLEVLPQYQNVVSPISSLQHATARYTTSKLRRTLGGIDDEKGYKMSFSLSSYYAGNRFFPYLSSSRDFGFLVPGIRNTSFWIRNILGQSFGRRGDALSGFYLGGFRNNYVDWREARQYRTDLAFPGADIDQIRAKQYMRTMLELNTRPIRLRNFGTTWMYPTHMYTSFFVTHLGTDLLRKADIRNLFNLGFQTDLELVLFSYMKSTWSAGYARVFEKNHPAMGQWMFSLKLLGQ